MRTDFVSVLDYGLARAPETANDATQSTTIEVAGTPAYMSPEQARRETLTPASDVFSLGLLARELIEGVHPLGDLRGVDAIRKLAKCEITADTTSKAPAPWLQLISRMLDPQPSQRPSAMEIAGEISTIQAHL